MKTVTAAERHLATTRVLACATAFELGATTATLQALASASSSGDLPIQLKVLWSTCEQLSWILLAHLEFTEESARIDRVIGFAPESLCQPLRSACSKVQPTKVSQFDRV